MIGEAISVLVLADISLYLVKSSHKSQLLINGINDFYNDGYDDDDLEKTIM